ncbi:MAG TPA: 30S ribosomal protein S8 [Candidatus Sumerlaeota bacterium]|jgi:small subunit ribosomal protein S8|nr:30S ribosomal protein S8 [Candidatus Sumerlaeota bacterium]HPR99931.1 30S ribosomal protein S8 [Candidatus Sumerlaeota bacterium]
MSVTDPIADMLTRIRNANAVQADEVSVPASRLKVGLAKILREEGFIKHYKVARVRRKGQLKRRREREKGSPLEKQSEIRIFLKYGIKGERVLNGLRRVSRPGLRQYVSTAEIPRIEGGLGICILSTSQGLLSDRQAKKRNIGGELLCTIW